MSRRCDWKEGGVVCSLAGDVERSTVYEQSAAHKAILKKQTEHCHEKRCTALRPKNGANTASWVHGSNGWIAHP